MSDNAFDVNKTIDEVKKDRNLAITVGGAALLIVSVFLPWFKAGMFGFSVSTNPGLNGTGLSLIVLAIIAAGALLNVLKKDAKQMVIISIVASALALLIVFSNYPNGANSEFVSIGFGYWAAVLGAAASAIGGLMKFQSTNKK